jgi:hypothetical protein
MRGKFLFAWVGWSNRQWVLFLLVLSGFILLTLVALATGVADSRLSNWLLLLSGIVVLLYTVETQGLRMEMVRQNEMTIQPVVTAKIAFREGRGDESYFIALRNIGRGPALQVQVKDIRYLETPDAKYRMKCKMIDFIEPGEEKPLEFTFVCETEEKTITKTTQFALFLDPNTASKSYDFEIDYKDIGLQRHVSVVRMGKGGNVLLGIGKVVREI